MKFQEMPYSRVDFEKAAAELDAIMEEFRNASSAEEEFAAHQRYYALSDHIRTMTVLSLIRHSIDTEDAFYSEEKDYYDRMLPDFANREVQYHHLLLNSRFRGELEKKIGQPAFVNMELDAKSVSEAAVPLMQEENALGTRYEKLLASAQIPWEGDVLNLSMMTPHLTSPDRSVRTRAAEAVNSYYLSIADELDEIYDLLVKNRTEQAKVLGFNTYTELGYCRMMRNSYGRAEVENFRRQVKEFWVPFAEEVWENRRKRLGLTGCCISMRASATETEARVPSELLRKSLKKAAECTTSFPRRPPSSLAL